MSLELHLPPFLRLSNNLYRSGVPCSSIHGDKELLFTLKFGSLFKVQFFGKTFRGHVVQDQRAREEALGGLKSGKLKVC